MDTKNRTVKSSLDGTGTKSNLSRAFDEKARAYTIYTLYADKAQLDNDPESARLFESTADQEKHHADLWFGYLDGTGDTMDNINYARNHENISASEYLEMSDVADSEGFYEIAEKMRLMSDVEKAHEEKFEKRLSAYDKEPSYDANTEWCCTHCGFCAKGNTRPERCPLCSLPGEYFEPHTTEYSDMQ